MSKTFKLKNKEYYIIRETVFESIVSDTFAFLMTVGLLYLTHNYFGNSWLALLLMFFTSMKIIAFNKNICVTSDEMIEILKNGIDNYPKKK